DDGAEAGRGRSGEHRCTARAGGRRLRGLARRAHVPAEPGLRRGGVGRAARAQGKGGACSRIPPARGSRKGGGGLEPSAARGAREGGVGRQRRPRARAINSGRCERLVITRDAGVGKSRLIEHVSEAASERGLVIRGRCLSYGDGITFWPLVEALRSAAEIEDADDRAAARSKLVTL